MEYILRRVHKAGIFGWLYVMTLLHAFHFFAIHFVNSSFLESLLHSHTDVGLLFSASSALTVVVLASTVIFLTKIGNYYTALFATSINVFASLGLAFVTDIGWIFVFFVTQTIMIPVTLFCFDVFLETYTKDENSTGSVRGFFLLMSMTASLFSPVISGWLIGDELLYRHAYLIGAVYLLPTLAILIYKFRFFVDPVYELLSVSDMIRALKNNRDIFHISAAQFFLRFYFSWMVVYMPIFLNQVIGFSWVEIGFILFLMIIPYIIIEYPAGIIADKYLGEKELLIAGYIITGCSTIAIFFVNSTSLLVWGALLFVTRIGCAFIEGMTETYFFKKIDGDDASILSIFRMLRPLAYTVGPLSAGILLYFLGDNSLLYLWPILGTFMLLGIFHAVSLNDTR